MKNRSKPPGPVVPTLVYRDVGFASDWLCDRFGFTVRFQHGPLNAPQGAFLNVGQGGCISLTTARLGQSPSWNDSAELLPPSDGVVTHVIGVQVVDVDAHFERATAQDFAGHRWAFSESVADVDIADWGGTSGDLR